MVSETKEATILDLSRKLNDQLEALHKRLDETFDRNVKQEKGANEAVPAQKPNVLDEIIAQQQQSSSRIENLHVFISERVIPKIH